MGGLDGNQAEQSEPGIKWPVSILLNAPHFCSAEIKIFASGLKGRWIVYILPSVAYMLQERLASICRISTCLKVLHQSCYLLEEKLFTSTSRNDGNQTRTKKNSRVNGKT